MNAHALVMLLAALAACVQAADAAGDHSQHRSSSSSGGVRHKGEAPAQQAPAGLHAQHDHAAAGEPTEGAADPHARHRQAGDHEGDHGAGADAHAHPNEPTESERAHVPPDPPKHFMGDMSKEHMVELMQMEDDAAFGMLILDQLEWREIDGENAQVWEFDAWYGDDYNKLWFETEGERIGGEDEGGAEVIWDRIVARWWSVQAGVRQDFGEGPSRTWVDIGVQGLAPYFFEIDAAIYLGEEGRTAARFSGEYDMLITQRLILQPELEFNLYGKDDPENGVGSGLSDIELGARLRYEIRREFAPYIGVHWERKFGDTAELARRSGEEVDEVIFVAGVRAWF
jgi:copper resistance protein B